MGASTSGGEKPVLHIAMVGHVDHGKSTLIGRIRHELSALPGTTAVDASIAGNWAWVADQLQEEREREMTIDTTQTFLETPGLRLVFIDVPGHQELIHNMLSGATRADAAVLVLAADEGVRVQTRRHALLLSMLGIHTVIVAANKMDLAGRSEEAFRTLERTIVSELAELGVTASATIPVVARDGDNVVANSPAMTWYTGPSLVEALGEVEPISAAFEGVRLPVQDVYRHDTPTVVGRLLSGTISEGDVLTVSPYRREVTVASIRRFPENHAPAEAGESVGLVLDGEPPSRGDVLSGGGDLPSSSQELSGRVFWLAEEPLVVGETLSLRCATQSLAARVVAIADRLDSATLDPLPAEGRLASMELSTVKLSCGAAVVFEPFGRLPGLGRFVLERGGTPAGFGIVP